jgi:hypothetical protein
MFKFGPGSMTLQLAFFGNSFSQRKSESQQLVWTKAAEMLTRLLNNSFKDDWHLYIKRNMN